MEAATADSCLDSADPRTAGALAVLHCYKGLNGRPVKASLMWKRGTGPLDVDQRDQADLERHRTVFAVALIIESQYYLTWSGLGAVTASHCEGFLHRFQVDGTHTAIYKRRREGYYTDGWPLNLLHITVPLAASPPHQFSFDQSLSDALLRLLDSGTDIADNLERALPAFLQGNLLSTSTTLLDDMVWMGAAFERPFDVAKPIGQSLAEAVRDHFTGVTDNQTTWTPVNVQGNPTTIESGPWRQRWTREFYRQRSAVHAGQSAPGSWSTFAHCVIAAEVFSLAVLRLLADTGYRPLNDAEAVREDALDARIEAMASRPADVEAAWARPLAEAQQHRLTNQITQSLANPPVTAPEASGVGADSFPDVEWEGSD